MTVPTGRFLLPNLVALLVLLASILLAACGGENNKNKEEGDEAPAASTAAADATPDEAPIFAASPAQALADLQSYRVAIRFTLGGGAAEEAEALSMNLEGAFVAPDRSQTNVTAHLGDLELREETIAVGDRTWVKAGDSWVEDEPQFRLGDLSPSAFLEDFDPDEFRLLTPTEETVNAVPSLRYSIGREDVVSLRGLSALLGEGESLQDLPEQFDIDLWLARDGGWPVRITMTARGAIDGGEEISLDFSLDVTDANNPAIVIEPPA